MTDALTVTAVFMPNENGWKTANCRVADRRHLRADGGGSAPNADPRSAPDDRLERDGRDDPTTIDLGRQEPSVATPAARAAAA